MIELLPHGFANWDDYWRGVGDPEDELGVSPDCLVDPRGRGLRIWFQVVVEPKTVKIRIHFDLGVSGGRKVPLDFRNQRVEAEAAPLVRLGATRVQTHFEERVDHYGVATRNPEGNEFEINYLVARLEKRRARPRDDRNPRQRGSGEWREPAVEVLSARREQSLGRRLRARHYWNNLEFHKVRPVGHPLLEERPVFAFHDLEATVEVGFNPTANVAETLRLHSAAFTESFVDGPCVSVLESLDHHELHPAPHGAKARNL